jgi:DNA polymerase III alpha subunit/intein/homing endonuclease
MTEFVNLHNHTSFSILDSLISVKDLFTTAKALGQTAVALTDHGSCAGVWDALKASKETGVKLIIGVESYFLNHVSQKEDRFRHIILLAKNAVGYKNLLSLNKEGFDNAATFAKKVYPLIDWQLLEKYKEGLICLTSCSNGIIAQLLMNKQFEEAEKQLLQLQALFGEDLGLEVQANTLKRNASAYNDVIEQVFVNAQIIKLARKHNIRAVATANSHYLKKEDHETHDVLMAIGSHQPIYSNFRLRYTCPEFYLKTGEEVKTFFERNYGEEYAKELCANSLFFADRCEFPAWIDPKFSNPTGKELPEFPCQDEADYATFQQWQSRQPETILALAEDKQFLRYRCEKIFDDKIPSDKREFYLQRLEEELDVLYYCGVSSYMLIVADYINWCKNNNVSVGPGRGCLTGDTLVQTDVGFKKIQEVMVGDRVFTHTGKKQAVNKTMVYEVKNEELLEIKLENAFNTLKLTNDHKIFACKREYVEENKQYSYPYQTTVNSKSIKIKLTEPKWIEAQSLKEGDFIYTTFPSLMNEEEFRTTYDLADFTTHNQITATSIQVKNKIVSNLSIREIARQTGISFATVQKAKNNTLQKTSSKMSFIEKHLASLGISFNEWQTLPRWHIQNVERFIKLDDELLYLLGRFTGDGSIRYQQRNGINYSFNKDDKYGIERVANYFSRLGFNVYHNANNNHTSKAYSLDIGITSLSFLFKSLFPDYQNTSQTKHLPIFFRQLNRHQLIVLMRGLIDSDGCSTKSSESIKTTSLRLAQEIKEALNLLHIASSVCIEPANTNYGRNNSTSYTIYFRGINKSRQEQKIFGNGYYSKITKINNYKADFVYDISVNEDKSYLTSSGVVHNSAGGSLVAYLLGIHEADPIKFGLVFSRFFNKLKSDFADVDVDFSKEKRHLVIDYIVKKYGKDNVASISNFITMKPKIYIKDVSRACELGGNRESAIEIGNAIADCISAETKNIDTAIKEFPLFSEYIKKYPQLEQFKSICNTPRALGTHAAGLIISKRPLHHIVPVRRDKDNSVLIEYDKYLAEENGLVKMDLLGLETLDIIDQTNKLIRANGKITPKIDYHQYDEKTYDLISRGDTYGVFQFGISGGTIDLCKKIKPKCIEDLAIITTLARPASRDIREDFIKTREGKREVILLHPLLGSAFNSTYGFPLYDESLLILAKDVAGWDLDEADKLRKLTKEKGKNPAKAAQWEREFIAGSVKNGVNAEIASQIWDKVVVPFGRYSFNKSHAVLYSFISFHTAYLKAHYPIEFLIANLLAEIKSNAPNAASNIAKIKGEIRSHKIKIVPPDINQSELRYVMRGSQLITGLDALKFVSDDAVKDIIAKRPFTSFQDFMSRVDSRTVRANTIQALAAAGCLEMFGIPRHLIFLYCSDYRKKLQVWSKKHDPTQEQFIYPFPEEPAWTKPERYAQEVFYLGEGFSCSKKEAYGQFFKEGGFDSLGKVKKAEDRDFFRSIKAIVVDLFLFKVKKANSKYVGQEMAKLVIEDINGERCGLTIFPDRWKLMQARIKERMGNRFKFEPGVAIHFSGTSNLYEEEIGMIMNELIDIAPPPQRPADLQSKKINLRPKKSGSEANNGTITSNPMSLFNEMEDFMFDAGLIDLDDENLG